MAWTRRNALGAGAGLLAPAAAAGGEAQPSPAMYGLISEIIAVPGKRNELAALLLQGTGNMAGCLSYVVAADLTKPDGLWVTEIWVDRNSHSASLDLPAVKEAIAGGRPLIAKFASRIETTPFGGVGLHQP